MSDAAPSTLRHLPVELVRLVEALCTRFEEEWAAGRRPVLVEYLQQAPAETREVLLAELLRIEVAYRRRSGEPFSAEEYDRQFPEDRSILVAVLNHLEETREDRAGPAAANLTETEGPGTVLGPYKLLERIGEGGFGVVFLAEQKQPIRRLVALKVLKPGMESRQIIARFEAERQALALMDHPHIARVLEGGVSASGRPYFVMDLVRGLPIDKFCDQNQLTLRARLELFVSVCQAVQHAHFKGIIHRDLKPSNVLVTLEEGTPVAKVIDFGIAKALGQQLTEYTIQTGFAQLIGTPLYMSPEQADLGGIDIDARTDIYSLGVVLYQLLTGTTPFEPGRLHDAGFDEMRRIIREEEPPRPSIRVSALGPRAATLAERRQTDPARLSQALRGELDWIVLKAIEKDRNRRYETASAFAADVRHYLHDEPVAACPPSRRYRFRKFARRNRGALTIAAVITLAVVLVTASIGWIVRDRGARAAALDAETDRAVQEAETLVLDGKWPEAVEVLQRTEKFLATAGRQELPPVLQELKNDVIMARRVEEIYSRPGRQELPLKQLLDLTRSWRQRELDSPPEKEDVFTGHEVDAEYARAFEDYGIDVAQLTLAEAAEHISGRRIRLELTRALDHWSSMRRRAGTQGVPNWQNLLEIAKAADPDPWRMRLRAALADRDRKDLEVLAASADVRQLQPSTLHLLGIALKDVGAPEQAVELLRKAQRQYPGDLWLNEALGEFYYGALKIPQYDQSVRFYTAALAVRPHSPYIAYNIGRVLLAKEAFPEAIAELSKAIDLKPDYPDALGDRGGAYFKLGWLEQAFADYSKRIKLDPNNPHRWFDRGHKYLNCQKYDEALRDFTRVIELQPKNSAAFNNRCCCYIRLGQLDKALAECTRATEVDPLNANAFSNCAYIYERLQQLDKAIWYHSKSIEVQPKWPNARSKLPEFYVGRANDYARKGEWEKAAEDYGKAIQLDPKNSAAVNGLDRVQRELQEQIRQHPQDAGLQLAAGRVYCRKGQWRQAEVTYSGCLGLLKEDNARRTAALLGRAEAYLQLKENAKALADLGKLGQTRPEQSIELFNQWSKVAKLLLDAGHFAEAVTAYSAAIKLKSGDMDALQGRAYACWRLGQLDQAIADCSEMFRLDPRFVAALMWRCQCYQRRQRWDQVIVDSSNAITLIPNWNFPREARADAYGHLGQWRKSANDYAELLKLEPDNQWHWHMCALVQLQAGDIKGYRATCRDMLKRFADTDEPGNAERTAKACLLVPGGVDNFEPILKLANLASNKDASNPWNRLAKALTEHRTGHLADAIECLNQANPVVNGGVYDANAFAVLALAYQGLGKGEPARVALAQAKSTLVHTMPDLWHGQPFGGDWHDWLRGAILCREAEQAVEKAGGNARALRVEPAGRLAGHKGYVHAVAFCLNGTTLASAGADNSVRFWDLARSRPLEPALDGQQGGVMFLAASPDGTLVVSSGRGHAVVGWDSRTRKQRWRFQDHPASVDAVAFSPDGKRLATASTDGTVILRDPATGEVRATLQGGKRQLVALVFSADGKTLIGGGGNWAAPGEPGHIQVWDVDRGVEKRSPAGPFGAIWGVALSPDGKTLAGACLDGTVRLWNTTTGEQRPPLRGHTERVIWVAFSPAGGLLASGSHDRTVRLWNPEDGSERGILRGHTDAVERLAFSSDGSLLATPSYDRTIRVWRLQVLKP
jgi:serine/threonine-protein kinase